MSRSFIALSILACVAMGPGCGKLFDLTPYDASPPDDLRDLTATHMARIRSDLEGHQGPFTFALTSDPHYHYGDLTDIVAHMRNDASIRFVVVPGDLSDQGLIEEFTGFARVMEELSVPWLATIGNHDHLGNGPGIYETMFGPRDFVMDLPVHRFIFFDDTVWESDTPPDLAWLSNALAGAGDRVPIVIAHIPPYSDQLQGSLEYAMRDLMAGDTVPLFIHGHQHAFNDHEPYLDGVRYLCVPWPKKRAYVKVTLDGGEITIDQVML